jgi:hypothetical protein
LIIHPKDLDKSKVLNDWWIAADVASIKSLNFGVEAKESPSKTKMDNVRLICEMNE